MPTPRTFTITNTSSVRLVVSSAGTPHTVAISGTYNGTVDDDTIATISVHPQDVEGLAGGHGEEGG